MPRQGMGVLKEQTQRFIDENPTDLRLTRHVKVPDGAGGATTTPTPLSAQRVRIVGESRAVATERRNLAGAVVRPDYNIIAMPTADIQRGDTFTYQGLTMEVVWVNHMGYEIIAEVAVR